MGDIRLPRDKGWTRLGPGGGGPMFSPTVSPHDPNTAAIACDMTGQYLTRDLDEQGKSIAGGIFRSTNGAESWARFGGANFGWPHRIIPDPFHAEKIHLTTFGGSVWHGPKTGTPGAGSGIVALPPVTRVRP